LAVCIEHGAKPGPRPVHPHPYGILADAESFGYFRVGESEQVPKGDDGPVTTGESVDEVAYSGAHLSALGLAFRRGPVSGGRWRTDGGQRAVCNQIEFLVTRGLLPNMIQRGIGGYAINPGTEIGPPFEPIQRLADPKKHGLRHILGNINTDIPLHVAKNFPMKFGIYFVE